DGERARSERRERSQWAERVAEEDATLDAQSAAGQQAFLADLAADRTQTATPTAASEALSIPTIDEGNLTLSDLRLTVAQLNIQDNDTSSSSTSEAYSEAPPLDYLSAQEGASYSYGRDEADAYRGAPPPDAGRNPDRLRASTPPEPERVSIFEQANVGDNPIRQLHGIGSTTEKKMHAIGIETVGQLAQSSVDDLSQVQGFSPSRSAYFIRTAQQHMGDTQAHVVPPSTTAQEIATAVDNTNNDDNARMVTGISTSVANALSAADTANLNPTQSSLLATQYGLPAKEGGDYLALSRAMQLSPAQSRSVLGAVTNDGNIGADMRASLQSSLGQLQTGSGQALDSSGIQRAINGLEQAAQRLASRAQTNANPSAPEQQLAVDAQILINAETGE
ncbi:MAG: helix-hairpin-helix domain-containing protein, partial [Phototrophicaceae bacterium]